MRTEDIGLGYGDQANREPTLETGLRALERLKASFVKLDGSLNRQGGDRGDKPPKGGFCVLRQFIHFYLGSPSDCSTSKATSTFGKVKPSLMEVPDIKSNN
jgi:hypothetical protein